MHFPLHFRLIILTYLFVYQHYTFIFLENQQNLTKVLEFYYCYNIATVSCKVTLGLAVQIIID